jgi:hypothetical protein
MTTRKKRGSIQIHDQKSRVTKEGTRVTISGYVVKTINKEGTTICSSDLITDSRKVKTYLFDMNSLWNKGDEDIMPADYTKEQRFTDYGIALPGI